MHGHRSKISTKRRCQEILSAARRTTERAKIEDSSHNMANDTALMNNAKNGSMPIISEQKIRAIGVKVDHAVDNSSTMDSAAFASKCLPLRGV